MRIAAYYPWVYLTSGIERTILEMYERSRHEYTIFTNHFEPESTFSEFKDMDVVCLPTVSVERRLRAVLKAAAVIALQKVDFSSYDCLLVHCDGLGDFLLNRRPRIPVACFCHTPLRPVFDSHYRAHASKRFTGIQSLAFDAFSVGFRHLDRYLWSRYDHVFFNSQESYRRARTGGLLRGMQERCEILHPGIDWASCRPTWRYEPYFLVPGRVMWTKNIDLAIHAFTQFKTLSPRYAPFRLVVAGQVDRKSRVYLEKLRTISEGREDIGFVVSPSDEEMKRLYANCYSVIFPAFNEDWGLVALEANAFGKPVVACDRGGPKESQQHGETGYLAPPQPEAFAQALASLATDFNLVQRMGIRARENSRRYDWEHFVNRSDQVLENLAEGRIMHGRQLVPPLVET
jgi:glycosyltransferase involved in cell wall biosynthesis